MGQREGAHRDILRMEQLIIRRTMKKKALTRGLRKSDSDKGRWRVDGTRGQLAWVMFRLGHWYRMKPRKGEVGQTVTVGTVRNGTVGKKAVSIICAVRRRTDINKDSKKEGSDIGDFKIWDKGKGFKMNGQTVTRRTVRKKAVTMVTVTRGTMTRITMIRGVLTRGQ